MRENSIGIFDSGVGGLSVLGKVRKLLPHEDILYFADTANFPYGHESVTQLQALSLEAAHLLLNKGAKLIVVACNTASSASLSILRATCALPFVGMVPAIKPATASTRNGKVGVIATQATVQTQVFAELLAQFAEGVEVFTKACPGLVETVERGETDSPTLRQLLRQYLDPMLTERIDCLVLGCTHYPFLRPIIQEIAGEDVNVIDSGAAVARQVERVLSDKGLLNENPGPGKITYLTSGEEAPFLAVAAKLLGEGS